MKLFTLLSILLLTSLLLMNCGSDEANSQTVSDKDSTAVQGDSASENSREGNPSKDRQDSERPPGEGKFTAVPVEVTRLTLGDIASYLMYSSTLETEQIVDVYSRIGGLVEEIYVEESNRVKKGAKLLQIEKDEYELAEQNARLEYEKQLSNFNRFKALQEKELLSEDEFENARLAMEQAKIAWKQAALNLEYTTVTAPIPGVIGDRFVRLGDRIQTTTKLFTLVNLEEKIVRIYVPQSEYPKCYPNQKAALTSEVISGIRFDGYVKRISPIIDPQSGTFKVTIAVIDPQNKLRPGMFVNAELIVDTHKSTPLIPKAALIYENERTFFFIVENDSSQKIELKKGFEDAEKVEVLNDLPVETKVVVLGQNGLKEGVKVKIIEERRYAWQPETPKDISAAVISRK